MIELQAYLNAQTAAGIPFVSAAFADRNGIIWAGTSGDTGLQQGRLKDIDTLLGIGSITKTFIALVILQLVQEERLSLDQTAVDILGTDAAGDVPAAAAANIAQLLNHTSGVPSWEDDPLWIAAGRGAHQTPGRIWKKDDVLSFVKDAPPNNAPGESYSYSNTNYTLLGLIIEKIVDRDLHAEVRERILRPIGSTDMYFEGFEPVPRHRLARRYHYVTEEFEEKAGIHGSFTVIRTPEGATPGLIDVSRSNLSVEWAAGGMVATASELAHFAASCRAGLFLNHDLMNTLADWIPVDQRLEVGRGLFRRTLEDGRRLVGHTGGVQGYSASVHWLEKQDLSIAVLANVGTMHTGEKLANATTLAFNCDFIDAASAYAKTTRQIIGRTTGRVRKRLLERFSTDLNREGIPSWRDF
ncbi:serine hydrolase domain-containing protein [Parasphingorhabdus sp.]|uniref:serine hydrolase domain-containing protein n=1 Tax=Parasphingorhabdus sp. TaxID=2709688 RepID=UPI0032EE74CB